VPGLAEVSHSLDVQRALKVPTNCHADPCSVLCVLWLSCPGWIVYQCGMVINPFMAILCDFKLTPFP